MIEAGQLLLPSEAHWLGEFKSELLSFPSCRYDDQVDALSQLLVRVRNQWTDATPVNAGPMLWVEGEGWIGEGSDFITDYGDFDDPWGA